MKNRDVSHFLISAFFAFFPSLVLADQSPDKPFAVVELFSSEGCSSCPAADLLMSKLTAWSRHTRQPVYPLIFHVDYWNSYGWRDVFSSPVFTQRQKYYAYIFKVNSVYTPEMVVNGTDAFTGTNQDHLQKDLELALAKPSSVILHLGLVNVTHEGVVVKYSASGFQTGDVINIALVERGLMTDVTAGENEGRILHHDNVVREFLTQPLGSGEAHAVVPFNKIHDPTQASIIAYVQNPRTMLIEAAQQLDFDND